MSCKRVMFSDDEEHLLRILRRDLGEEEDCIKAYGDEEDWLIEDEI